MTTARRGTPMFGESAASVYDRCPAPDYSAVLRWISRVAPRPGRACDVGCGTGSLMLHLSAIGWRVEGCDPSSAMVRAARGKNPGARVVRACTGSFRPSGGAVDLITATFDVVNHLPSRTAMRSFFRRARGFLAPGGVLVFDSVTPDDIDRNWRRYVEVDRPRGVFLVRTGERLAPDRGSLTYEIFRKRPDGAWDLEVERHELRSASSEWFRGELLRAGFANVRFVDAVTLRAPTWRTVRWLVAARVPLRASPPSPRAPSRSTPRRARRRS